MPDNFYWIQTIEMNSDLISPGKCYQYQCT